MQQNPLRIDNFHPTIGSAYHAVERYREHLAASSGKGDAAPPLTVFPIDSMLLRLLTKYQPSRPIVVDLAAASTWGVSTLLCRTDSSIHRVVSHLENPGEKWRTVLDLYLRDWSSPLAEWLIVDGMRDLFDNRFDSLTPTLAIAGLEDAAKQQSFSTFEKWFESAPQTVFVLLGAEKTGGSSSLASLIARCTGSDYRLALARELAPAFAESRIALVFRRENSGFESVLVRIAHLFANQFHFLDLIRRICDSALDQGALNDPLPFNRGGVLEPHTLITAYDLRRTLLERERELQDLRQSLTFRIVQRIRGLRRFIRRAS